MQLDIRIMVFSLAVALSGSLNGLFPEPSLVSLASSFAWSSNFHLSVCSTLEGRLSSMRLGMIRIVNHPPLCSPGTVGLA